MTNPNSLNSRLRQKHNWIEVLAEELLSTATRTSEDFTMPKSSGLILWVKTDNEAGTCSFTPSLQMKDPEGTAITLWTAASAITADGSYLYVLSPNTATGMGGAGVTETALVEVPNSWNIVMTYSGTPASDKSDTQVWAQGL